MFSHPHIKPLDHSAIPRESEGVSPITDSLASFAKKQEWMGFFSAKIPDPLGICDIGKGNVILSADASACWLFGKTEQEISQTPLRDFFEESAAEIVERLLMQAMESGEVRGGEVQLSREKSPAAWVHIVFIPENGSLSRIARMAIVGFEGIHDYLLMSRAAMESASNGIYWITPDAKVVDVNTAVCSSLGYNREELIGMPFQKIDPILTEKVWALAFRSLHTNGSLKIESVHTRKDGTDFPVEVSVTSVCREGKELACAFVSNIQSRKRMEENLLKLRMAVEQSANSIVITDKDGTIEYVNAAFTQISGYAFAEAVGKNPAILKSGFQKEEFYQELWETITGGQIWRGAFHNKKKDGSSYWEKATISPILDSSGNVSRFIAVKEDITAQRLAEKKVEDLRRRLAMSEQDERKRIAAALHDSTVQDLVAVHMDIHRAVKMIGSEYSHARDILMDAMAIIENNANELRYLSYDLHAPWLQYGGLLSGVEAYARKFALRSEIEAIVEAPQEVPRLSQMKEISLYRIVQESLTNVLRHSSASRVRIRFATVGGSLEVSVCDDGGASPEVLEKASSQPLGGVGILSMKERVEAMGGTLTVTRDPDGVSVRALVPMIEEIYEHY